MPSGSGFKKAPRPERAPIHHTPIRQLRIDDGKARLCVLYPKDNPLRSEKYLAIIRKMKCIRCGVRGHTQAAHADGIGGSMQKGIGMKADDRAIYPACGLHTDANFRVVQGCHYDIGTGGMYSKDERRTLERGYVKQTILEVIRENRWPKDLPLPNEEFWK